MLLLYQLIASNPRLQSWPFTCHNKSSNQSHQSHQQLPSDSFPYISHQCPQHIPTEQSFCISLKNLGDNQLSYHHSSYESQINDPNNYC